MGDKARRDAAFVILAPVVALGLVAWLQSGNGPGELAGWQSLLPVAASLSLLFGAFSWLRLQDIQCEVLRRREAETALRASEALSRNVLNATNDAVLLLDLEGVVLDCNNTMAAVLGYPRDEVLHRRVSALVPRRVLGGRVDVGRRVVASAEPAQVVDTYRGRAFDSHYYPLKDEDGQVYALALFARDITERRATQVALTESESRFRLLVENSLDGYFTAEPGSMRLQYTSGRFQEMSGYPGAELLERSLLDLLQEAHEWQARFQAWETGASPISEQFAAGLRRRDGSTISVDIVITSITSHGHKVWQGVCRDITERERAFRELQQLEQQLYQAQKMEAVGTLASGVAHDFNNLLQSILSSSFFLRGEWGDRCSAEAVEEFDKIRHAARRGGELGNQLLAFSRAGEGTSLPFDLNAEVEVAARLLERTLPKAVAIEMQLEDDLPKVLGDPVQVQQVLLNLAVNARDAMPDGGRLTLQTTRDQWPRDDAAVAAQARRGECLRLRVADTGSGINERVKERMYDPFFTTKKVGDGTGLGLAVVYGIVKHHGGTIHCRSAPGRGTCFDVRFPLAVSFPAALSEGELEELVGGRETILVVDDELEVLDQLRRALTLMGYTVFTASDGESGVRQFRCHGDAVDLVILDLIMPEKSGEQCMAEILDLDPSMKILVESGYCPEAASVQVHQLGAQKLIRKPFRIAEVMRAVREVLDGA